MQLIALTLALLLQDEDEFSKPHIEMHRKVSPAVVFVRGGSQTGTGFLVDRRGIVVTSTTAIGATSTTATVQLQGHKQLSAKVVGRADDRELVLLQLETPGTYPHLELGDSDSVRVGQIAYAFGDSFDSLRVDDQCHMSLGVVSGFYDVSQEKTRGSKYKGTVLEVSCAVNQNQDGGPIVDLNYEESKFTGFAIPVNVLKPEIERVVKGLGGPVVSTSKSDLWVGLEIEETDDGLVVSRVYAKSPAEKSGVKKGDLLVRVNGKKVLTTKTFGDTLAGLKAGDAMQVRVKRNGKDMDLSLTLAKKPVY
jgi:serine protease Do